MKSFPNYLGESIPYDPTFNGPLGKRSCTDVLCLAIFVVFIAAWAGIGLYAILNGDPSSLLIPQDSTGRKCGRDTDVANKPYLFFHDLTKCLAFTTPFTGCKTPQVCVANCPTEVYIETENGQRPDYLEEYSFNGVYPKWILPSSSVQKRCIPNLANVQEDIIDRIVNITHTTWNSIEQGAANVKLLATTEEIGLNVLDDIMHYWWKIVIGILIALLGCMFYIILLRWIAAPMVWISIFGVIVGLGVGLYFTVVAYIRAEEDYTNSVNNQTTNDEGVYISMELKPKRDLLLAGVIIISVVLFIILLVLIFLRKRIMLAVALIKEGSKAVSSVTAVLFFPIIPWVLHIFVISYAVLVGIYLGSTGKPLYRTRNINESCSLIINKSNNAECDPLTWQNDPLCIEASCKLIMYDRDNLYGYLQAYNIIGLFWLICYVIALGQMVLAGVFAQWYWTFKKSRLPFFAVTSAFARTLRFHMGTIAFGSLIIAICKLIRVVLEYVDHKVKKYDNELTRAIMCFFKCFFYCLEKFLKFLNKNAYIMCAIHGKNFCASSKDAFSLLMRNILRVWVLDKVTDFLFFLSKILLTLAAGAISYVFFATSLIPIKIIDNSSLHYGVVPVIIIMISTYFISSLFFNVYSMAVDTLFLCFLEDCERNDGTPEKPYFMSKTLMKIFGKKMHKVE